jgi:tetratricopeptide (TPR) repeat protein
MTVGPRTKEGFVISASNDSGLRLEKLERKVAENPNAPLAHVRLGMALLGVGSSKRAEAELKTALELDPECVPALVNLGGIYLNRWDFTACIEVNRRAAALCPDTLAAYYNQGLGHLYQNEPEQMVACFRRVIALDESHGGGHYHLAVGLLALGQREEAKKELSIAMKLGYKPEPTFLKALDKEKGASKGSKIHSH